MVTPDPDNPALSHPSIAAVLLAAGESSRMGSPKPLLPWQGVTLVEYQAASLLKGGVDEVYVVTGAAGDEVARLLSGDRVHRVHNADYLEGKTTSVRAGVRAVPAQAGAIVALAVDQPRPAWVVRRVIESHLASGAMVTSPRFRERGGHPLAFDGALRRELLSITEENEGIREVMRRYEDRMNRVEFDTEIVRLDINTPETYRLAAASYERLSREPSV